MRVILVLMGDLYKFPPALSLVNALSEKCIETVVVSTKPSGDYEASFPMIRFEILPLDYDQIKSPVKKMVSIPQIGKDIWERIDNYYNNDSIIWVVTDVTLKYLGKKLMRKNYVLHMLELSQDLLYYKKIPFLKLNATEIGNRAKAIVVPEYNRAHIMAAWWNLKTIPYVLPNKPVLTQDYDKNSLIEDEVARAILDKIGDKKIILYQGILNAERPLHEIIKAVDCYDGKYAFVVMSGNQNIYSEYRSENYYYIPYVRAPKHLQITSHAHIGVLSYVPTYSSGYSPLNALYCAPNKIFEFSKFGIPMIGNDIPGLRYLFETEGIGSCFNNFDSNSICNSIDRVEAMYNTYSINALNYYKSCDYGMFLERVLNDVETKLNKTN